MQRLFYKAAAGEVLEAQDPADLDRLDRGEGWIWLDITEPAPHEILELGGRFGLDRVALEDVAEPTEFPKVDDYGHHVFLVLHGLGAEEDGRLQTTELDAFIGEDFLLTFHRDPVPSLDLVIERARTIAALSEGGPDRMIARVAEAQARRFLPVLDGLDHRLAALEDEAIMADPVVVTAVQALRRDIVRLRKVVVPQRDVMLTLSRPMSALVSDRAQYRFGDVYDHLFRLTESLDAARLLLASELDTYRSAVAERMNDTMRVLTVFAAILLPMSLAVGYFGMNFVHLPGAGSRWALWLFTALLVAAGVGLWLYFVWRGFIGGPRLADVPRGVSGLARLAARPAKTVSGAVGYLSRWIEAEEEP